MEQLEKIRGILVSDKTSSNVQLVRYFHDEMQLELESISFIIGQREAALANPEEFKLNPEGIIV